MTRSPAAAARRWARAARAGTCKAGLALATLVAFAPRAAFADVIDDCLAAHPEAQRLRQDGKLLESRAQLLDCARPACPAVVRAECGRWLTEVDALTPSVLVSARSPGGTDLTEVRVVIDGTPSTQRLDGRETLIDPGPHTLRLEAAGFQAVESAVVIREGEKARLLAFTMRPEVSHAMALPAVPDSKRPVPIATWALGAVGVAALGSFSVFGLVGRSQYFDLRDRCGSSCSQSDVASMRTNLLVADVSLVVSVLAVAAATYVFLTRPTLYESRRASAAWAR